MVLWVSTETLDEVEYCDGAEFGVDHACSQVLVLIYVVVDCDVRGDLYSASFGFEDSVGCLGV